MFVCSCRCCEVENVLPQKKEILKGRGVHDYGILRAWGVVHFGVSEGKGGGYGYFLELPFTVASSHYHATQLIKSNYLVLLPTDAAPQFL